MSNQKYCSLYVFLAKRLIEKKKDNYSMEIEREDISRIFRHTQIAKNLHWNILKDMENFGLIKIINKNKINILYKEVNDGLEGIDTIQKMAEDMTQKEIAKEVGISQPRVSKILKQSKDSGYFE